MHRGGQIFLLLFIFFSNHLFSQTNNKGIGEVAEIIFPASADIKDNFTLYYEIHLDNDSAVQPSFWYKIVFGKDCAFNFTLFPLLEQDRYDFYLFKVNPNTSYCEALQEGNILAYDPARVHRVYDNTQQSAEFRAGLVEVKSTPVKAGEAIYLEVFNTRGKDCGHVLDFRTDSNSFVVKTINDNCDSNTYKALDSLSMSDKFVSASIPIPKAMNLLEKELCPRGGVLPRFTSVQFSGGTTKVNNNIAITDYKPLSIPVSDDTIAVQEEVSYFKPISHHLKVKKVKSTADLNMDIPHYDIQPPATVYEKGERDNTRLEVDKVLFALLLEKLKKDYASIKDKLSGQYQALKHTKNKVKRKEIAAAIKKNKEQRTEIQTHRKSVKAKMSRINRLLVQQRKEGGNYQPTIFSKSMNENIPTVHRKGLVYRVQIGAYKNVIDKAIFKGLSPIYADPYPGGIRYSVGAFSRLEDAREAKKYIADIGLSDAFVVVYLNGERISFEAAKKYQENITQ